MQAVGLSYNRYNWIPVQHNTFGKALNSTLASQVYNSHLDCDSFLVESSKII